MEVNKDLSDMENKLKVIRMKVRKSGIKAKDLPKIIEKVRKEIAKEQVI